VSGCREGQCTQRTFRPRVNKAVERYLVQPVLSDVKIRADRLEFSRLEADSAAHLMTAIGLEPDTPAACLLRSGPSLPSPLHERPAAGTQVRHPVLCNPCGSAGSGTGCWWVARATRFGLVLHAVLLLTLRYEQARILSAAGKEGQPGKSADTNEGALR